MPLNNETKPNQNFVVAAYSFKSIISLSVKNASEIYLKIWGITAFFIIMEDGENNSETKYIYIYKPRDIRILHTSPSLKFHVSVYLMLTWVTDIFCL